MGTALTDDEIDELTHMIQTSLHTTKTWHEFLDNVVDDAKLVNLIKAQSMRSQWSGYRIFDALSAELDMEYAMIGGATVKVHGHGQGAKGGHKAKL